MSACSMDRQIVEALYKYEVAQFKEPDKPRNKKALEQWKLQHAQILTDRKNCDSFVIIDWYDSTRRGFSGKSNIEYYGSQYYFCNDTGYIFRNHDSIQIVKKINIDRRYDFIEMAIHDSIANGTKIEVIFSGTTALRIIQIVKIKKGRISITGFNLNRRLRQQDKI